MRILIATATVPIDFPQFCTMLRDSAKGAGIEIPQGIWWTGGYGCTNLALDLIGDDKTCETFANGLTMALMPSKWQTTRDCLPEADTYDVKPKEDQS